VLGAYVGIVSSASLVLGVAAAGAARGEVLTAGIAGLAAGAMSMAAGEYVSVSSQADAERSDVERERRELATEPRRELAELTHIYAARGLDPDLAAQVAQQLMAHDALGAHVRDELGLTEARTARPLQAALASAAAFAVGAALPLATAALAGASIPKVAAASLGCLAVLGAVSARAGGASAPTAAARVTFWGALAMGVTAAVGAVFGAAA
jgi:VIT1/CCC1 family predicted Fe2+/Mn2+ transporter